jgi:hypothetical protein
LKIIQPKLSAIKIDNWDQNRHAQRIDEGN